MTFSASRSSAAAVFGALMAFAVPAALPAAEVTGRVIDESEAPIAGARVTLHPAVSPAERGALWLSGRQYPPPVGRARTGPDGSYRLVVPDSEARLWTVVARTAEHVPMERDVGPLFDSIHLEAVRLVAREPTSVQVVGPGGEAVSRAAVLLRISPSSRRITQGMGSWRPAAARVARSAKDGHAELARAEGEDGRVQVVAPGRLAVADLEAAGSGVALPAAGGDLLGVVGTDGKPAPDVVAWWAPDGLPAIGEPVGRGLLPVARYRLVPVAAGGEDGSLRLPAGLPGDAVVRLQAPDGAWASLPAADREPAPGTAAAIRLRAPVTLSGTVRERQSGEPVAHALVWAESDRSSVARSDEKGRYHLTLPGPEATAVAAAGPRHQPVSPEVAVYGESASDLVLATEPVLTLTGHVESGDGSVIDGATVVAQPSVMTHGRDEGSCGRARALSTAGGRFRLPGLTRHCDYHLEAWREGHATARLDVPPLPEDATRYEPVRLVLPTGQTLIGRVVALDGAPVPGARVQFHRYTPWIQYASHPFMETRESLAETDAAGRFEIGHVAGGRGRIVVEADGFVRFERERVEVPVEPGETMLGDLELEPEQFLDLVVVDDGDRPVEGARVMALRSRLDEPFGGLDLVTESGSDPRTDPSGHYRIAGFRRGDRATLRVSKDGFVDRSLEGVRVPDDSPARIVLVEEAVVTGRVVDERNRAVTEARVGADDHGLRWEGHFYSPGLVDENGRFKIDGLAAGPVRLRAVGPEGARSAAVLLEMEAGEHRDGVELVLRSRPSIVGRVLAPNGDPVVEPNVFFRSDQDSGSCQAEADGTFCCEGLEPGTYTLTARKPWVGQMETSVVLADTDVTAEIFLEPEVVISGRLVTADGKAVPDRVVMVHEAGVDASGASPSGSTEADGSFTIPGVGEGTYELAIASSPGILGLVSPLRHPELIVVRDGLSVTGLEIRLPPTVVLRGNLYGLPEDQLVQAIVGAEEVAGEGMPRMLGGEVGSGGGYEIPGLGPGTWTVVAVGADGEAQARAQIEILPGEEDPVLDLRLARGTTLSGLVLLDGAPWTGVGIGVLESASGMTQADLQGRFELPGVPSGRQEIVLMADSPSESGPLVTSREVMVEEGREVVIDVVTGHVRGSVSGPSGPLADAQVVLEPVNPNLPDILSFPRVVTTAADGRFRVDRLPEGAYVITFAKPGHAPNTRELHVTGGEVELSPVILEPETR